MRRRSRRRRRSWWSRPFPGTRRCRDGTNAFRDIDGAIKYTEDIIAKFDKAGIAAVRNYQQIYEYSETAAAEGRYKGPKQRNLYNELSSLYKKVLEKDFKQNEKVYFDDVPDSIAEKIQSITKIDVHNFKIAIEARMIDHIIADHGKNGKADNSMENETDVLNMIDVISSPTEIRYGGKTKAYSYFKNGHNKTADTVLLEKKYGGENKSYYVVEAVPDTKSKTIYIVTAFIGKSNYKKTEGSQLTDAVSSPVATSENDSAVPSVDNISQSVEKSQDDNPKGNYGGLTGFIERFEEDGSYDNAKAIRRELSETENGELENMFREFPTDTQNKTARLVFNWLKDALNQRGLMLYDESEGGDVLQSDYFKKYNIGKKTNKIDKTGLTEKQAEIAENLQEADEVQYQRRYVEKHIEDLKDKYDETDASVPLNDLLERYAKIVEIWDRIGGELNSEFLNRWNDQEVRKQAFTVFKAQQGYKYNIELASMCKKGIPLFEAIDTIVREEVSKELKSDRIGKAEKQVLYGILKEHHFEIPCAICYVEQARQREGDIINDFVNGKESSKKIGWNQLLTQIEAEMKNNGVDYKFPAVDRSIATMAYKGTDTTMSEKEYEAFSAAIIKLCNKEIDRWNSEVRKSNQAKKQRLTELSPEEISAKLKGTLPGNLRVFKTLMMNANARFSIDADLLYSSATTYNLSTRYNPLYSLFNSQGGVGGYKSKQRTVAYMGDLLGRKSWTSASTKKEGGIRNQSNSDLQMYTLLDQVQMYIDASAKGFYMHAYTKVLAELKLFGLSGAKINASLIPKVVVYGKDGRTMNAVQAAAHPENVDIERTMSNAGLDENGNPIYDDIEGIMHDEAFMLASDPEYSKNIGLICIGYSDNHIVKLLDDERVQLIIGFHDKTNDGTKRYPGARYSKNYNGLNEAVTNNGAGETKHINFAKFVSKAENKFPEGAKSGTKVTVKISGETRTYDYDDIPNLAADLYLEECAKKGYAPAYNIDGIVDHPNYYKVLADFALKNSEGHYAPQNKVAFDMPDTVPYLDNGKVEYESSEEFIKRELQSELSVRDSIAKSLEERGKGSIIGDFVTRVNEMYEDGNVEEDGEATDEDFQYRYGSASGNRNTLYDFKKPFAKQLKDYQSAKFNASDTLVVGGTPEVFKKIGLLSLPVTIATGHVNELLNPKDDDHTFTRTQIEMLPDYLKNPIAIIDSTSPNAKPNSIVVIIDATHNGKQAIAAVVVEGYGEINGRMIDSHAITTVHTRRNTITKLLKDAVDSEVQNKGGIYYWQKNKAIGLLNLSGVQFSGRNNIADGYIRTISDPLSKVNSRINNITNTVQFKEWFGKWKDHPETINPALLNEDGTPRVFYHGTPTYGFTAFREGEPIFLTSSEYVASTYSGTIGKPDGAQYVDVRKLNLQELAQFMTEHNDDGITYSVMSVYDRFERANVDKIVADGNKNAAYSYESAVEIASAMPQTPGNYPMYVSAKNLLVIENAESNRYVPIPDVLKKYFYGGDKTADTTEIAKAAQKAGFDGVMFKGIGDIGTYGVSEAGSGKGVSDVIAVFKSTQVKSATDNIGMFSPYESDFNYQYRTGTLSDRDVLRYAAENFADQIEEGERKFAEKDKTDEQKAAFRLKTDGQKYALQTFNEKLKKLDDLTIQREQLGKEWHEQQFGSGDRTQAAATLNRMKTLDAMIEQGYARGETKFR